MCVSPINIRSPNGERVNVPCGKCYECLSNKKNGWVLRLKAEYDHCTNCKFITLTYDNEHLPFTLNEDEIIYHFNKKHVQKFFQDYRDKIRAFYKGRGLSSNDIRKYTRFRYFLVSEYGGDSLRPHYHFLIFNYPSELGLMVMQDCWPYGFVHYDNCEMGSIVYCAKYLFKPEFVPSHWEKPFMLCSKGIGKCFLSDNMRNYIATNHSTIIKVDEHPVALPRYYSEKIFSPLQRKVIAKENMLRNREEKEKLMLRFGREQFYRLYKQSCKRKIQNMFSNKNKL